LDFLKSTRSPLHTNLEEDYFAIHALAKFMYTSTASSFGLVSGPQIAYVVVHADEYAIQASRLVKNSQDFQKSLQQHLQKLLQEQVNVILLNLQKTEQQPPKFLRSLGDQVTVIPSLEQDSINAQSERLSKYLVQAEGSETTGLHRWLEKRLPEAHAPPDSDDKRSIGIGDYG
jgi:hypothetical protein